MPFIFAGLAAIGGALFGAVGAVVAGIVGAVGGLVAGIAAVIGPAISGIISAITTPIGQVISTVASTAANIVGKLSQGITGLRTYIDATTGPILNPIKSGWQTINNYIKTIKETVTPFLEPFEQVADVINTYRDIKILGRIITGTEGIAKIVNYASDGKLLDMASAVSNLFDIISATTVGILERQNAERESFNEKLFYIDRSVRGLIDETQSKTLAKIYGKVTEITGSLLSRIAGMTYNLRVITRRTEDLPWFQTMLLRALE